VFQVHKSKPKPNLTHKTSQKIYLAKSRTDVQICAPSEDIQHWRGNETDKEIIDLYVRRFFSYYTQFEAVLIATPRARKRVGNISEGRVHAIGPHDIPYESVKKSKLDGQNEIVQINAAQIFPSSTCPRQSGPTYAATAPTPR
jgi:hypothetical protein